MPDRSAVDPVEFKQLLPNILIAETEHEPFRVKYRLQGTKVTEITGRDIARHYLDELLSAEPDQRWQEHYLTVCRTGEPLSGLRRGGDRVEQFITLEDYFGLVGRPTRSSTGA